MERRESPGFFSLSPLMPINLHDSPLLSRSTQTHTHWKSLYSYTTPAVQLCFYSFSLSHQIAMPEIPPPSPPSLPVQICGCAGRLFFLSVTFPWNLGFSLTLVALLGRRSQTVSSDTHPRNTYQDTLLIQSFLSCWLHIVSYIWLLSTSSI